MEVASERLASSHKFYKRGALCSSMLRWLSLRGRVWHSLNTQRLGNGSVFTLWIREMGVVIALHYVTESKRLRECNISKHIMAERRWHAWTECWWREKVRRVSVLFQRCVCFVCLWSADGVMTLTGYNTEAFLLTKEYTRTQNKKHILIHNHVCWFATTWHVHCLYKVPQGVHGTRL